MEQRINEPAPSRTQAPAAQPAPPARQPAAAPQTLSQGPPQLRPAPAQAEPGYITLQPGETLSYISALYGVSEKNLVAWNGLASTQDIRAGQRLVIRQPGMRGTPPAPQSAPPDQDAAAQDGFIVVASGQSLSDIARRHGVTVPQLREWNALTGDTIQAGQRLRIQPPQAVPGKTPGAPVAEGRTAPRASQESTHSAAPDADGMITVQSGQNLSSIAAKYKVSTANLRQWNKLKNDQLHLGQKLRVKAPVRVHTVKAGENLTGIAAKYKVTPNAILQKNKLTNADVLPVGKDLIIP